MGIFDIFKTNKKIGEINKWQYSLNNSLKNSFKHVKDDMDKIIEKIKSLDGSKEDKFEEINQRLKILESVLINSQQQRQQEVYEEEAEEVALPHTPMDITDTQKAILLRLKVLLEEKGANWLLMRELAEELYPTKDYDSIKSMISNYIDVLSNLNLIKKTRKGRNIYVTLTDKARKKMPKKVILSKIKKKKQKDDKS